MYKLICTDFDNTLIDSDESVPFSTVILLDSLRRKNILITVITSRCLKSVLDYTKDCKFIDYIIAMNGAYVYDVINKKTIYKKNILISNVKKIIKKYYEDTIIYLVDDNSWKLISKDSEYGNYFDVTRINDYNNYLNNKNSIYKMDIYFKDKKCLEKAYKDLKNENLKININMRINDNHFLLEIVHSDVDRYSSLLKILKKKKVTLDEVLAFGNRLDDTQIIKNSGLGIAVKNASSEVKKVCDDITLSNNEKGVETSLKKVFNI